MVVIKGDGFLDREKTIEIDSYMHTVKIKDKDKKELKIFLDANGTVLAIRLLKESLRQMVD